MKCGAHNLWSQPVRTVMSSQSSFGCVSFGNGENGEIISLVPHYKYVDYLINIQNHACPKAEK